MAAFDGGRRHLDLLHQLPLVGVHRVELEHHVMRLFRRRRITQIAQRVHPLHGPLPLAVKTTFNTLRLVHDENRARRPNQIDGLLSPRLLAGAIHHIFRFITAGDLIRFLCLRLVLIAEFVDGTDRHHHDLDLRAGSEVTDLAELRGVVNKEIEGRTCIQPLEVLPRSLNGVIDAFLDRH